MASGPGVDKPRTENHPNRQVGPHLSQHWRTTDAITGPMGAVTAHMPTPSDSGITMAAWSGSQGHHAEVEQDLDVRGAGPYSGIEHNRYVAGPFRTQVRAQIAAESLANRVEAGSGHERYENDSWTEYSRRRRY